MKSAFDNSMNQYTTPLDKTSPTFHRRLHDADRLAAEIEGSVTSRAYRELENGDERTDDGDEEMRHSAVIRPHAAVGRPGSIHNASQQQKNGPTKSVYDYICIHVL